MRHRKPITPEYDEDYCRCCACGLRFVDSNSFTRHRAGPYPGRRCKTVAELARGWRMDGGGAWMVRAKGGEMSDG